MRTTSPLWEALVGELILLLGGARSGKSDLAERLARSRSAGPVIYVATGQALDEEMSVRIERHRATRPAQWRTVDAPLDPAGALAQLDEGAVILDCITMLVSNLLLTLGDPEAGETVAAEAAAEEIVSRQIDALLAACAQRSGTTILVSNEVGLGMVPPYPLGRLYRDVLGRTNRRLTSAATAVYLVVAGVPIDLKKLDALPDL